MTEPIETSNYKLPLQQPGTATRQAMNEAIRRTDTVLAQFEGFLGAIFLKQVQVHFHPVYEATAGQKVFELAESFQTGVKRLYVTSGLLAQHEGIHWNVIDADHIEFVDPREEGELVSVIEFQVGNDHAAVPAVTEGEFLAAVENPAGVINSTDGTDGNGVFTLLHPVADNTVLQLEVSGSLELVPNEHFTWSGVTITILPPNKPTPGETLTARYVWRRT